MIICRFTYIIGSQWAISLVVEQRSPKPLAGVRFPHRSQMNIFSIILIICLTFVFFEFLRYSFGFHSFLKKQKRSWIGFDLDGTLAFLIPGPFDPKVIGDPILPMVKLLQRHIHEGKEVKILTARVSTDGTVSSIYNAVITRYFIQKWCQRHIGKKLDIVSIKDFKMKVLYDDSVVRVEADTGKIV